MNRLEEEIQPLRFVSAKTMRASLQHYLKNVLSKKGRKIRAEKRLYPKIAHILLAQNGALIPLLLKALGVPTGHSVYRSLPAGSWIGYRLSTRAVKPRVKGEKSGCFPGAFGNHNILDIGFFLNADFGGEDAKQIKADRILYFEIKSQDKHRLTFSQIEGHLKSLVRETPEGVGYLICIGGKIPKKIVEAEHPHPRWLGHISLENFFSKMQAVAKSQLGDSHLAKEISELQGEYCPGA